MDNQTILWIVIGVVALVIIGVIIWAVTRNNDDEARKERLGKGGTVRPRRGSGTISGTERVRRPTKPVTSESQRNGPRRNRDDDDTQEVGS